MIEGKSLFITLEGCEGAGKTTLMSRLTDALCQRFDDVVATREPGGTALGERIRELILKRDQSYKLGAAAELLLILAARAQHIEEVILPALDRGAIVLCDRFIDSTIAYQGAGRDLGVDYVEILSLLSCQNLMPDHTLLLDLDPVMGLARSRRVHKAEAAAGEVDRMEAEALAFHQKVRQALLDRAAKDSKRITVIDASQPLEDVVQAAQSALLGNFV